MARIALALAVVVAACATVVVYGAQTSLSECTESTNGDKWWKGLVQLKCEYENDVNTGVTRRHVPVQCRTPTTKTPIAIGDNARDGDFNFVCEDHLAKDGTLVVVVGHCYVGESPLAIHDSMKADGGTYTCLEATDDNENVVITREFVKDTLGCTFNGVDYKVNQYVRDGESALRCVAKNGAANFALAGCYVGTKRINLWSTHDGKFCQPSGDDALTCQLIEHEDSCTDEQTGGKGVKAVTKKWIVGDIEYQCQYNKLWMYKKNTTLDRETIVKPIRCVTKIPYEQNGQTKTKTLYIWFTGVAKFQNKWYSCPKGGAGGAAGDGYGVVELEDAADYTCADGTEVWQTQTKDNVVFKCDWNKGNPIMKEIWCVNADGKTVKKNKFYEQADGEAYKCVAQNGRLVYYRLSDDEYAAWKAGDRNAVSALGGGGGGAEEFDEHDFPTCSAGFELNKPAKRCDDIDECEADTDNCGDTEFCKNLEGSFKCLCKPGLTRMLDESNACVATECGCATEPEALP